MGGSAGGRGGSGGSGGRGGGDGGIGGLGVQSGVTSSQDSGHERTSRAIRSGASSSPGLPAWQLYPSQLLHVQRSKYDGSSWHAVGNGGGACGGRAGGGGHSGGVVGCGGGKAGDGGGGCGGELGGSQGGGGYIGGGYRGGGSTGGPGHGGGAADGGVNGGGGGAIATDDDGLVRELVEGCGIMAMIQAMATSTPPTIMQLNAIADPITRR